MLIITRKILINVCALFTKSLKNCFYFIFNKLLKCVDEYTLYVIPKLHSLLDAKQFDVRIVDAVKLKLKRIHHF